MSFSTQSPIYNLTHNFSKDQIILQQTYNQIIAPYRNKGLIANLTTKFAFSASTQKLIYLKELEEDCLEYLPWLLPQIYKFKEEYLKHSNFQDFFILKELEEIFTNNSFDEKMFTNSFFKVEIYNVIHQGLVFPFLIKVAYDELVRRTLKEDISNDIGYKLII